MKKITKKQRAEDNELLLRGLLSGKIRWERWDERRGELCFGGIRYCVYTNDGIPEIRENIRKKLQEVIA